MNVSNLILRLQKLAAESTDAFELMVLAKSIEKIRVGSIQTVNTFNDLPTLPLAENGELFLVEADEDLYYNVETSWERFRLPDFVLSAWGLGADGRLGNETVATVSSPIIVIDNIKNWKQISAGRFNSLGVTDDGIAYAWGLGSSGRNGDNTTTNKSSPVTVAGGITNWSQVSAGFAHNAGVTADGIAYAWGNNGNGRLGDGAVIDRSSPITVVGGITNWKQLSAGSAHSLGVTDDGIAYAWGSGNSGRTGDNTTINRSSPVTVVGGITNWKQVSAGGSHSIGLTNDGIAYAWGSNYSGDLGDNTTTDKSSPVTVVGNITSWSQVSAGSFHSIGITDDGIAYAWGYNIGRLGDDTVIDRSSPVTVVGGITNWSQVSAGNAHNLGVTDDGIAYAWGLGSSGKLGDGSVSNRLSPVTVIGNITSWSQVSAGGDHSLAIYTE